MTATYPSHQIVLHTSRFRYADRRLFFTRARLYMDRIELLGWHLGKKHTHCIRLRAVERIEWNESESAAVFHLEQGHSVRLQLQDLGQWKATLENRLHWSAPGRFPLASTTHTSAPSDFSLHELVTYTTSMG